MQFRKKAHILFGGLRYLTTLTARPKFYRHLDVVISLYIVFDINLVIYLWGIILGILD